MMKKLFSKTFSERASAIILLFILIAGITLLMILTKYTAPYYDDYGYGYDAKVVMAYSSDVASAIKAAANEVHGMWYAWQGTHASIFFMALMPAIWGEQYYYIGGVVLILNLCIALFLLTGTILKDVFGIVGWKTISIQSFVTIIVTLFLYSPQQGFYWFNGGFHYVGMHSYLMVLIAVLIHLLYAKEIWQNVLLLLTSILLGLVTGGSNFITGLQAALLIASLIVLCVLNRQIKALLYIPCSATYAISFYYNVIAPGNSKRAAFYVGWGMPAHKAIFMSFVEAVKWAKEFSSIKLLVLLILLIPISWRIASTTKHKYKLWKFIILAAWSICFFASSFTPNLYSTGRIDLARLINVIKINYHILLICNMFYFVGWVRCLFEDKGKSFTSKIVKWRGLYPWPILLLVCALSLLFFKTEPDKVGSYSYYGAAYYLFSGEARQFYSEYMDRVEELKGEKRDIVFESYTVKPWFLICEDLSTEPSAERNRYLSKYYGQNSVCIEVNED